MRPETLSQIKTTFEAESDQAISYMRYVKNGNIPEFDQMTDPWAIGITAWVNEYQIITQWVVADLDKATFGLLLDNLDDIAEIVESYALLVRAEVDGPYEDFAEHWDLDLS